MTVKEFKTETIRGYCPFLESQHCIEAKFQKYHPLGAEVPFAIGQGFSCDYQNECSYVNECPIYGAARNAAIW